MGTVENFYRVSWAFDGCCWRCVGSIWKLRRRRLPTDVHLDIYVYMNMYVYNYPVHRALFVWQQQTTRWIHLTAATCQKRPIYPVKRALYIYPVQRALMCLTAADDEMDAVDSCDAADCPLMCIWICTYVFIYRYINIYKYIHIYTHIYIYIYIYIYDEIETFDSCDAADCPLMHIWMYTYISIYRYL